MRRAKYILAAVGVLLICSTLQASDAGTESPFSLGAGARDLALGGAALTTTHASTAPLWNPSRLATAQHYYVSGFHSSLYESDVAYQYFSLVVPTLDFGCFAFGVSRLSIDGIERRDHANVLLGEFDDSRLRFSLAYGARVSGYEVGFAAVLESHSIDDYSATSSPGLDLSVTRRFDLVPTWLDRFSLSLVGRNLLAPGTKLDEEMVKQPSIISAGASLTVLPGWANDHRLLLTGSVSKPEAVDARFSTGVEYDMAGLLALRGGLNDGRPSFGAGLAYKGITFDYALIDQDLGGLHMFTLTTAFGSSVDDRRENRRRQQETEFNSLMQDRLTATNRRTVEQLVKRGKKLLDDDQLIEAHQHLDRALLLARGAGLDTTEIADLSGDVRGQINEQERVTRYEANLKAAQARLIKGDYLAARHFAELALVDSAGSPEALAAIESADEAIEETSARNELIEARLLEVDSLLSYGYLDQALTAVKSLERFETSNANVRLAIKRVEFESWREKAAGASARGNQDAALAALDSALARFPGHQWCVDFRNEILRSQRPQRPAQDPVPKPKTTRLSQELEKEAESALRAGQRAFEQGDLREAIAQWERVDRIAPDYGTVREYLMHAYKFVGVELYGQNKLAEAVEVWRKAARLNPENEEIQEYIRRTENEIRKLEELSYESE
ncbi:hypothetical protein GF377_07095 [candidate division GN15 bacterium]|nr:hypothetical protein [candidate division GN15 bacterium]